MKTKTMLLGILIFSMNLVSCDKDELETYEVNNNETNTKDGTNNSSKNAVDKTINSTSNVKKNELYMTEGNGQDNPDDRDTGGSN